MRKAWFFLVVLTAVQVAQAGGRKPPLTGVLWDSTVMHDLGSGNKEVVAKPTPPWWFEKSVMSPDGKQLLFMASMYDENNKPLATDLRTLDMESRRERVWYRGSSVFAFNWSPDGRFIITEGLAPEYVAIIIDTQTEEAWLAKIPKGLVSLIDPIWSRDGRSLYLARSDPNSKVFNSSATIVRMDLNGENVRDMVTLPVGGGAALSPDEKTVAYSPVPEQNLYFVDVATGKIRSTKWTPPAEAIQSWSLDGKWVAVRQDTARTMAPTKYYAVNAESGEWRFIFKIHGDTLSWWQPATGPLPDCGKIVREQLGPGRPLQEVAEILFAGKKSDAVKPRLTSP